MRSDSYVGNKGTGKGRVWYRQEGEVPEQVPQAVLEDFDVLQRAAQQQVPEKLGHGSVAKEAQIQVLDIVGLQPPNTSAGSIRLNYSKVRHKHSDCSTLAHGNSTVAVASSLQHQNKPTRMTNAV